MDAVPLLLVVALVLPRTAVLGIAVYFWGVSIWTLIYGLVLTWTYFRTRPTPTREVMYVAADPPADYSRPLHL